MTRSLLRGLLTGLLLTGIAVLFHLPRPTAGRVPGQRRATRQRLGTGLFMLCYALATVLMVPGSLLTLAGGALFRTAVGHAV